MGRERTWVIIPAYNEEETIAEVLRGVRRAGFTNALVVDDGSQIERQNWREKMALTWFAM